MAKQLTGFIEGTIDEVLFYKMEGHYYLRLKSSLTGKRFWKDKAFEGSRRSCSRFAEGNKLASLLYKKVEEEKRVYSLFLFLKKRAIALLKEGKTVDEAGFILEAYLVDFGLLKGETSPLASLQKRGERVCVDGATPLTGLKRKRVNHLRCWVIKKVLPPHPASLFKKRGEKPLLHPATGVNTI